MNKLQDRLGWLEKERTNLEQEQSDLSQNQRSQLKSLEKVGFYICIYIVDTVYISQLLLHVYRLFA